jgi:hypothetical protein
MKVVLSYGMGVDSTAILLGWLVNPKSRTFDLRDLLVLTAQIGDEFQGTGQLVEEHVLPLLRRYRVRFVQVARGGLHEADGIVVLDDTTNPQKVHLEGAFALSTELLRAGTVPQYASGQRRCSQKYKGWVLDTWLEHEFGGREFRHVIGFNADEPKRVERDRGYSSEERHSEYPLFTDWEWDRDTCVEFIRDVTGVEWQKSCCTFCPFAGGKAAHVQRLWREPEAAGQALLIETMSLALNPRMTLYAGGLSLRETLEREGAQELIAAFEQTLDMLPWTIYHVRRIMKAPGRGERAVERLTDDLSRADASRALAEIARRSSRKIEQVQGLERVTRIERAEDVYPSVEEFAVAAPATVEPKQGSRFTEHWTAITGEARECFVGEVCPEGAAAPEDDARAALLDAYRRGTLRSGAQAQAQVLLSRRTWGPVEFAVARSIL